MCFTFLSCNIVSVKGSNIYNTIVEIHETELIAGLKSGESRAYRTLFDNYYHLLFRIACQYVRDDTVADTIVGDVLSIYGKHANHSISPLHCKPIWSVAYVIMQSIIKRNYLQTGKSVSTITKNTRKQFFRDCSSPMNIRWDNC